MSDNVQTIADIVANKNIDRGVLLEESLGITSGK